VILWEWVDARGRGAVSNYHLEESQRAKLDERLDRIEELESLDSPEARAYIFPLSGRLKKLKIRGNVALRPIVTRGPSDRAHELTFLLCTTERDGELVPSKRQVVKTGNERIDEILVSPERRQRYERD
jgi:hypothetical protein